MDDFYIDVRENKGSELIPLFKKWFTKKANMGRWSFSDKYYGFKHKNSPQSGYANNMIGSKISLKEWFDLMYVEDDKPTEKWVKTFKIFN